MAEGTALPQDVMAYDEAYYIDVEPTKASEASPDIQLMSVGVTSMEETSNPTEVSTQYIGDKSMTNKVTGYDNQFAFETNLIKNDKVVEYIYDIFKKRKTGINAEQDLFIVELWNPVASTANTYQARKIRTTAVIDTKTLTPGENINITGTLKGVGDFIYGTFNTSTKTFTEDGEEEALNMNSIQDDTLEQ